MAPGFAISPNLIYHLLSLPFSTILTFFHRFFPSISLLVLRFIFLIPANQYLQNRVEFQVLDENSDLEESLEITKTMVEASGLVQQRKDIMTVKHANNKVRYVNKTIRRNRYKKKKEAVVPRVPKVLQELFVSCRDVFKGSGTIPSTSDVKKLCSILDKMKPEHVGLSRDLEFFRVTGAVRGTPRVTYTTICQCDEFELCIFFLPATAVIPLHNHPGMTVFSKLLLGKMHIKSYDWVDPVGSEDSMPPSQPRLARLKANSIFSAPCDTSVLYPTTGGNIHQFTAITPCAVLDVLGPPYSKEDDRDCSYYKENPYSAFSSNGETTVSEEESGHFGWLEEIEAPENSQMDRIEYLGPQVIETSCL